MEKKVCRLPDTELEIMKVIWNNNTPISTSKIKECLELNRRWNVSALQTLLSRLIKRGFLRSTKEGKNRYYEPTISEDKYLASENKIFLKKLNNNSITRLIASLYDSRAITQKDLIEIKKMIEGKMKEE